jgi:hypothetical protein
MLNSSGLRTEHLRSVLVLLPDLIPHILNTANVAVLHRTQGANLGDGGLDACYRASDSLVYRRGSRNL